MPLSYIGEWTNGMIRSIIKIIYVHMNKSIVISIVVILLGLTVASSYAGVYYYRQYRLMVTDSQK